MIGYLLVSTIQETTRFSVTEITNEFITIGDGSPTNMDLKCEILADKKNPYYDSIKQQYTIPPYTATTLKIKYQSSPAHLFTELPLKKKPTKKEIARYAELLKKQSEGVIDYFYTHHSR